MQAKAKVVFSSAAIVALLLSAGGVSAKSSGAATASQAAAIRYAKPGGAVSGNCTSWANACELRYALGTVAVAGDEIWVAQGTYKPTTGTDRYIAFQLKDGVALYGGFVGTETARSQQNWTTNITILSGDIGVAGEKGDNSYHVISSNSSITSTTRLDGFTITGGNAKASDPDDRGGGLFNRNSSSLILANLIFSGNGASYGGGMSNYNSSPTLINVTFSGNTAGQNGGGLHNSGGGNPTLTSVTFSGNSADDGGGIFSTGGNMTLTNVTFSGNGATYSGGMYNSSSSPTLTNVTFSGNSATDGSGGGMTNSNGSPTLTNVTFSGNSASVSGGGIYNTGSNPTLTNVTFSGNSATYGGGMYNSNSSPSLTNVTFSGNSASVSGGGIYNTGSNPTLTNITFGNNSANNGGGGIFNTASSSPIVRNTLFVKGAVGGNCAGDAFAAGSTSNIADDTSCGSSVPYFATIKLGVLGNHGGGTQTVPLLIGSEGIDDGNPAYCPATDQRGFKRVGQCDIGAYEAPRWSFVPLILKNNEFFFEGPVEAEDNDVYTSANGPLRFGRDYTGLFDDEKDFFSVRLPTAGTLNVTVTRPASPSPTTLPLQLQLLYWNGNQLVVVASRTGNDALGRQITYPGAAAGWYYLYLNAGTGTPTNQPYTLQVTY